MNHRKQFVSDMLPPVIMAMAAVAVFVLFKQNVEAVAGSAIVYLAPSIMLAVAVWHALLGRERYLYAVGRTGSHDWKLKTQEQRDAALRALSNEEKRYQQELERDSE